MIQNNKREMRILGRTGDTKILWNVDNKEEIKSAKEIFEKRIKEGWSAFKEESGEKGERIKIFDPNADRIILVPPIAGG